VFANFRNVNIPLCASEKGYNEKTEIFGPSIWKLLFLNLYEVILMIWQIFLQVCTLPDAVSDLPS
jgi:hypothetical protein